MDIYKGRIVYNESDVCGTADYILLICTDHLRLYKRIGCDKYVEISKPKCYTFIDCQCLKKLVSKHGYYTITRIPPGSDICTPRWSFRDAIVTVLTGSDSKIGWIHRIHSGKAYVVTTSPVSGPVDIILPGVQVPGTLVGSDISTNVTVIETLTMAEDSLYGYDFSNRFPVLSWGSSDRSPSGTDVYLSGTVKDSVQDTLNEAVETLNVTIPGPPGFPYISKDGVIGMSGGPNQFFLQKIIDRIISDSSDFTPGLLGLPSYSFVAGDTLRNLRTMYNIVSPNGIYVNSITPGSGLDLSGILPGDILLKLGDIDLGLFCKSFTRITHMSLPGDTVEVVYHRPSTGYIGQVTVTIG